MPGTELKPRIHKVRLNTLQKVLFAYKESEQVNSKIHIQPGSIKIVIERSFLFIKWKINHSFTVSLVTLQVGFNSRFVSLLPDAVI